jgi:hypothetical protein
MRQPGYVAEGVPGPSSESPGQQGAATYGPLLSHRLYIKINRTRLSVIVNVNRISNLIATRLDELRFVTLIP